MEKRKSRGRGAGTSRWTKRERGERERGGGREGGRERRPGFNSEREKGEKGERSKRTEETEGHTQRSETTEAHPQPHTLHSTHTHTHSTHTHTPHTHTHSTLPPHTQPARRKSPSIDRPPTMRAMEPQMQWYVSSLCASLSPGLSVETTLREMTFGIALVLPGQESALERERGRGR